MSWYMSRTGKKWMRGEGCGEGEKWVSANHITIGRDVDIKKERAGCY